jgi:integrase
MTFTNLDEHLWLSFEKHLYDKGLCTNTVRQINRNIKTALNYYANKGYIQHSQFRNYIKTDTSHDGQEEKYQILTTEDIQKLKNYQPKNQREIVYKDIFLIQTALGLRISDMLALNSHNVNMDEQFIALTTQKTKSSIKIPFSDYIKSLFEKYPSRMPIINESSYNYFIKIICKKAGITEEVSYFVKKGKSKVEIVVPKYKLISSHTARRTMITNALQKGMLPEELMKITGHKSRQSFDKYVQPNREQAIEKFRNLVME